MPDPPADAVTDTAKTAGARNEALGKTRLKNQPAAKSRDRPPPALGEPN
jgi:hypothetical protein